MLALDDGHPETKLRAPDGGDIAPGPAPITIMS